jgi:hypothetical protein
MRQKLELEMWDVEYGSEYRVLRCGGLARLQSAASNITHYGRHYARE